MLNYPTMWNPVQSYPALQPRIPNFIHTVPSNQTRHFFSFKFTIFASPAPEQLTYLIPPYERALTRRPFTVCSRIVPFDWDRGRFLNGIASYVEQHISCRMFSTWKVEGRREGGGGESVCRSRDAIGRGCWRVGQRAALTFFKTRGLNSPAAPGVAGHRNPPMILETGCCSTHDRRVTHIPATTLRRWRRGICCGRHPSTWPGWLLSSSSAFGFHADFIIYALGYTVQYYLHAKFDFPLGN